MLIAPKTDDCTKIIDRVVELLQKNGFEVNKDPARCLLLKLVIG
jgi:hypothetical protein